MNKTILKISGIVAIALGSVALFITGVGESAVIAIVSAVFVLAGLILAIFKPKGSKAVEGDTFYIELIAVNTRTRGCEIIGTVNKEQMDSIVKALLR